VSPQSFTIPADPGKADQLAGELGELATAAEWKRSAIVYARVRVQDEPGRPTAEKANSGLLSPAEFALLGVHGLRSKTTIRRYWQAWNDAISEGLAQPMALGDEVELPDAEWDDYYRPADDAIEPYYRPSTSPSGIYDPMFENDEDEGELGHCPPLASDVEQGEQGEEPYQPRRPPSPPLSPEEVNANRLKWVDISLGTAVNSVEAVARDCARITEWGNSAKLVVERIERIRVQLTAIEQLIEPAAEPAPPRPIDTLLAELESVVAELEAHCEAMTFQSGKEIDPRQVRHHPFTAGAHRVVDDLIERLDAEAEGVGSDLSDAETLREMWPTLTHTQKRHYISEMEDEQNHREYDQMLGRRNNQQDRQKLRAKIEAGYDGISNEGVRSYWEEHDRDKLQRLEHRAKAEGWDAE
jgi:cell division septum initiation protein DivIVA